jgi:hypothetical protein
VPGYRLYFLDEDGHITNAQAIDCPDDDHALRELERIQHQHAVEIWERARLVGRKDKKQN